MAVRMVFHGTQCQYLSLAAGGSSYDVGHSSVDLVSKVTRRHAGSVRAPSSLFRGSKGGQQLSWIKSEFNGPLSVRGLRSTTHFRGFARKSNKSVSSSGVESASVPDESSHAPDSDAGDKKFSWLETLGKTALPVAILAVGTLLRTLPSLALASNALQEVAVGPARKQLLASAWTGLAAGCLHTLTGPDHLAALAPLSIGRSRLESAAVGALWGCGHDTGQVLFGIVFLLLKDKLHLDLIRTWAARVVGVTLITIGGIGIMESQEMHVALVEGGGDESIGQSETRVKPRRNIATFATGVVHGLQPDALLMVLPALALPSRLLGVAYLGMFLVGTVIAMGSYTFFIASCSQALQKKVPGITKRLTFGSSCIAIALGSMFILGEFLGISLFGS